MLLTFQITKINSKSKYSWSFLIKNYRRSSRHAQDINGYKYALFPRFVTAWPLARTKEFFCLDLPNLSDHRKLKFIKLVCTCL